MYSDALTETKQQLIDKQNEDVTLVKKYSVVEEVNNDKSLNNLKEVSFKEEVFVNLSLIIRIIFWCIVTE